MQELNRLAAENMRMDGGSRPNITVQSTVGSPGRLTCNPTAVRTADSGLKIREWLMRNDKEIKQQPTRPGCSKPEIKLTED